jgi:hypothetical protein
MDSWIMYSIVEILHEYSALGICKEQDVEKVEVKTARLHQKFMYLPIQFIAKLKQVRESREVRRQMFSILST